MRRMQADVVVEQAVVGELRIELLSSSTVRVRVVASGILVSERGAATWAEAEADYRFTVTDERNGLALYGEA